MPRSSSDLPLGDSVARGLTLLPRSSPFGGVAPSCSRDDAVARGLAGVSCGLGDSLPAGEAAGPGDSLAAGEVGAAGETLPAGCEPAALVPLVAPVETPVVLVRGNSSANFRSRAYAIITIDVGNRAWNIRRCVHNRIPVRCRFALDPL